VRVRLRACVRACAQVMFYSRWDVHHRHDRDALATAARELSLRRSPAARALSSAAGGAPEFVAVGCDGGVFGGASQLPCAEFTSGGLHSPGVWCFPVRGARARGGSGREGER
jgi:hypothetical protein